MLIHLADTLYIIEIAFVKARVCLLLDNEELPTSLCITFNVGRRRFWNNVRDLLTAYWVENMHVEDTRCGMVPYRGRVVVLVYILD